MFFFPVRIYIYSVMKYYFISCSILLNSVAFTYNVKLEDILSYVWCSDDSTFNKW